MSKRAPAWLIGIAYLPFGFFTGFFMVAMPFLLTARGMPLDRVGAITVIVLIPTYTSFLLTPLADCGLPRRTWAFLLAAIAALCAAAAVPLLNRAAAGETAGFTALITVGLLAAQMYCSTMGGMTPNLVEPAGTATVSAWLNVANLGGIGLGGQLAILSIQHLGLHLGAFTEALIVFAPSLLLLAVGKERRVPRGFGETFRRLAGDLWTISRTRAALIGLLIFITPSATFAAINFFSGMGADFHASPSVTTWLTGAAGNSLLCSIGAFLGGWLANRVDRRMLFVGTGVVAALGSMGMAFGPRTALVFCAGVGFYYLLAGVNFAACSAAAFDIIGPGNPLSATQFAVLMAACNVAIETVVFGDTRGYAHFGARGLLLTDALFSMITGAIMLVVIRVWGGSGRELPQRDLSIDGSPELI